MILGWDQKRCAGNPVIDVDNNPGESIEQYVPAPVLLANGDIFIYVKGNATIYAWKSTDGGLTFSLQNNGDPVVVPGPEWDSAFAIDPAAIYDQANGTIHLYYKGGDGTSFAVGHATASDSDPTIFTKDIANPILEYSDITNVLGESGLLDLAITDIITINGTFYFYGCYALAVGGRLFYATGNDWNTPIVQGKILEAPELFPVAQMPSVFRDGVYWMVYTEGLQVGERHLRVLTSQDGKTWTPYVSDHILFRPVLNSWESMRVYAASLLKMGSGAFDSLYINGNGQHLLYYSASNTAGGRRDNVGLLSLDPSGNAREAFWERESIGGGQYQLTIYEDRRHYANTGSFKLLNRIWERSDDLAYPYIAERMPYCIAAADDGGKRILPTREEGIYLVLGAPHTKSNGSYIKHTLATPTNSSAKMIWTSAGMDMDVIVQEEAIKVKIRLKGGWMPPSNELAFPINLSGLVLVGPDILSAGQVVMTLAAPNVVDLNNPTDVRAVNVSYPTVGGQEYVLWTLPDLTGMTSPEIDPTLTLQPDPAAGLDTSLDQGNPDSAWAATSAAIYASLFSTGRVLRGLIKFDLSSIPAGATISSAILTLYAAFASAPPAGNIHRVLPANSTWTEAAATWNTTDGSTSWAGSAGCGTSGTDYAANVMGTYPSSAVAVGNPRNITLNLAEFSAMVASNQGMLIKAIDEGITYNKQIHWSSDYDTAAQRPKLVVDFVLPAGGAIFNVPFSAPFRGPFG